MSASERRPAEVAEQHRCPANRGDRLPAGLGDGVGHDTLVGALAQLAGQHPVQVVLFVVGSRRPESPHHSGPLPLRAAATDRGHPGERLVDVVNRQ